MKKRKETTRLVEPKQEKEFTEKGFELWGIEGQFLVMKKFTYLDENRGAENR